MADELQDSGLARLRLAVFERPDDVAARVQLAELLPYPEALELLREGMWFVTGRTDRLQALAAGFEAIGAVADAVELLEQAIRAAPQDGEAHAALAGLWARLGDGDKANHHAERAEALGVQPDIKVQDGPTPLLVRGLFDQYAGRFDEHLTGALQYRVPEELAGLIAEYAPQQLNRVLDLGCGTGLMAPHLRAYAEHLTGIDLSPAMLEQAARRSLYDDLAEAEAVAYLADCPFFDLIVAADVLVYIGNLVPLFAVLKRALSPSGQLFVTVETHLEDGFILTEARRYAHSYIYIESIARSARLDVFGYREIVPRYDAGQPVRGAMFGLRAMPSE